MSLFSLDFYTGGSQNRLKIQKLLPIKTFMAQVLRRRLIVKIEDAWPRNYVELYSKP